MAEEAHATLSPSSSDRWIACPGSIAAQASVTEKDEGSKASREGTVAHSLLELCIIFRYDPQEFLGIVVEPGLPEVAQHMIDGVRVMLDWMEEYIEFYGADKLIIVPEHRVYIGSMIGVPDDTCNGTSDLMIAHKDMSMLVVVDYKHGLRPVDAEQNSQMMLYTAGGIKEHGKYKEYKNVIVQPRAAKKRAVEETTYKNAKLTTFLQKAGRSAQAALLPNAPRVAGEHCFFCKAKDNCQTRRAHIRAKASDEFGAIEDPEHIPDDQLEEVLAEADELLSYVKAIQNRALRLAVAGHKFTNYDLGWGPRRRVFQDTEEVAEWCKRNKVKVDDYMPRAMLTPKQLETVLKRLGVYPRARRGEERPASPLAHLIGYTVPIPALKRRGIPSAEEDFSEDE